MHLKQAVVLDNERCDIILWPKVPVLVQGRQALVKDVDDEPFKHSVGGCFGVGKSGDVRIGIQAKNGHSKLF